MSRLQNIVEFNNKQELVAKKYYWLILCRNVETYVRGYDVCLSFKTIHYKPYKDLQSLPVST